MTEWGEHSKSDEQISLKMVDGENSKSDEQGSLKMIEG